MSRIVLAFVSDVHAGSSVAVCPPSVHLDDGGSYVASNEQVQLWRCWGEFWNRVDEVRNEHDAKLWAVFNGDLTEGDHHGTTQILSGNPTAQAAVVDACMAVPLKLSPDRLFFVRGTEAHVGKSACYEERIARGLQKDGRPVEGEPTAGTASWWHLRLDVNGLLVDVTHHGRTGQREHTRANAANLYAHDILLGHVKDGHPIPGLCVRAHFHKWMDSWDSVPQLRVIGMPCWQLATAYVHKKVPDSLSDIGGLIVVVDEDGSYEVEKVRFHRDRGHVWKES